MFKLDSEKVEEPEITLTTSLDHRKSKRIPENQLLLLHYLGLSLKCVDHNKLWKILQEMAILDDLNLPPEKPVCRSRSNTWNWTWNNGEDPDLERSTSRLCIVTLLV